jgi:hypothetical protein
MPTTGRAFDQPTTFALPLSEQSRPVWGRDVFTTLCLRHWTHVYFISVESGAAARFLGIRAGRQARLIRIPAGALAFRWMLHRLGREGPFMSGPRRIEVLCGLLAVVWGLALLLGAYLQPYTDTRYPQPISLHPGFTPIEYPFFPFFGVPIVGIALGAIVDGVHPFFPARLLLVIATVAFTGQTMLAAASIGLCLLPATGAGITASVMSFLRRPSGTTQDRTPTSAP